MSGEDIAKISDCEKRPLHIFAAAAVQPFLTCSGQRTVD